MTKVYDWQQSINQNELDDCVKTLENGGLIIFPTELSISSFCPPTSLETTGIPIASDS